MKYVLFLGGPDDGRRLPVKHQPVHHGAILRTFVDRPMSTEIAARVVNGDEDAIGRHAALDRFDYRVIIFRCDDHDEFVAIDNALDDSDALRMLIERATASNRYR